MVEASYDYIGGLKSILITLAGYYPDEHFDDKEPAEYFSDLISSRYNWHRNHIEPDGLGTGGTIVNTMCTGCVINDVEQMIEDMVTSLAGFNEEFEYDKWTELWQKG